MSVSGTSGGNTSVCLVLLETRDGAFLYLQGECSVPELPDWTETERVRQQEKERFVRIAGLHIKTNTGGRNEHPQKITEKE
nr:hypothetical protein [Clostridium sp. OF09-10]